MDEEHRAAAPNQVPRAGQSGLDVHLRGGCIQLGPDEEPHGAACLRVANGLFTAPHGAYLLIVDYSAASGFRVAMSTITVRDLRGVAFQQPVKPRVQNRKRAKVSTDEVGFSDALWSPLKKRIDLSLRKRR